MNEELDLLNPPSTDFSMLDYDCAYIDGNKVRMNYKYVDDASKKFSTAVISRGWRRFGKYFFHPICNGCNECKSIRIGINDYKFSKSQRKVIRKNEDTQIIVQEPTLTSTHIDLYNKYHAFKHQKDGWSHRNISQREYHENFVDGAGDFGKEVLYIVDGNVVGVDLIDILDDGISSIYFYYDPDFSRYNLGKLSLYYQIIMAKERNFDWVYLGYYVKDCPSLAYKADYKPYKTLQGRPNNLYEAVWI